MKGFKKWRDIIAFFDDLIFQLVVEITAMIAAVWLLSLYQHLT